MKKLLFLASLVAFLPIAALAANGDNCRVDIASQIPNNENWANVYIIHAPDGSAWQRAPLGVKGSLKLKEREVTKIYGTASPGRETIVFVFSPEDNGQGGIKKPGLGTCFEAGVANMDSQFSLDFNSRLLWGNLGENIMMDAFYKMEGGWDRHIAKSERESQNFFIGTHSTPTQVLIEAYGEPGDCPIGCEESGMVQAIKLDPVKLEGKLLGNNFDGIGGNNVDIGRMPGIHTFYGSTPGNRNQEQKAEITKLSMKVLTMENLKRMLLANPNSAPSLAPGLTGLSASELREAAAGTGGASRGVQDLARMIRTIMTNLPFEGNLEIAYSGRYSPTQTAGLLALQSQNPEADTLNIPSAIQDLGGQPPTGTRPSADEPRESPDRSNEEEREDREEDGGEERSRSEESLDVSGGAPVPPVLREDVIPVFGSLINPGPIPTLPTELFPPETSTDLNWAEDFLKMMEFWTGSLELNGCLAVDDPLFKEGFLKENFDVKSDYVCEYVYVQGLTPTLILDLPEAVTLKPDFENATIAITDKSFDAEESWQLSAGKKDAITYRYDFTTPFSNNRVADFCVTKDNLNDLTSELGSAYGLNDEEKDAIKSELLTEMKGNAEYYKVSLADPREVAKRFIWNGNGEVLDILQLFFDVTPNACEAVSTKHTLAPITHLNRDGFEAGILE